MAVAGAGATLEYGSRLVSEEGNARRDHAHPEECKWILDRKSRDWRQTREGSGYTKWMFIGSRLTRGTIPKATRIDSTGRGVGQKA